MDGFARSELPKKIPGCHYWTARTPHSIDHKTFLLSGVCAHYSLFFPFNLSNNAIPMQVKSTAIRNASTGFCRSHREPIKNKGIMLQQIEPEPAF